jgi:hypothetical protein
VSTWQDRLRAERSELTARISKLRSFVGSQEYLDLTLVDQDDLHQQMAAMTDYERVLARRVGRLA